MSTHEITPETSPAFQGLERVLKERLICVTAVDKPETAVSLTAALLAGGMKVVEITLRTPAAIEAIRLIRQAHPQACVGAGTVLSPYQAVQAADAGAQFLVAPGLDEEVMHAAQERGVPFIPGVVTPTEVTRALKLGCRLLKFFPAEASGGVAMLKVLAGPFAHTGARFMPTGGITAANLGTYLALPQVAAVGGSWMADKELLAKGAWDEVTVLAAAAIQIASATRAHAK